MFHPIGEFVLSLYEKAPLFIRRFSAIFRELVQKLRIEHQNNVCVCVFFQQKTSITKKNINFATN